MMSNDVVYSNVKFKAKRKSKPAFDGNSDDIDYTLIDFSNFGNKQRRPNAAKCEDVTYSAIKIPQPGSSTQPVHRNAAESDVIYSRVTQPQRDDLFSQFSAQRNEHSTQSEHTPAVFTSQSDPIAMTMTPARGNKQSFFLRPTFLLSFCILFLNLTVILGVLYSLEGSTHSVALGSLKDLNISYGRLSREKTSLQEQLSDTKIQLQQEISSNGQLKQEKKHAQQQLQDTKIQLQQQISSNGQLKQEKKHAQQQLQVTETELKQQSSSNDQLKREKELVQSQLQNAQKSLDDEKANNVRLLQIRKSVKEGLNEYLKSQSAQEKEMLAKALEALQNGCTFGWDWKHNKGTCYYFSPETETSSWHQSRDACQAKGGHLVIIDTEEKWASLKKIIPGGSTTFYWIGLTDIKKEGEWRWVDNKGLTITRWTEKQPDNWTKNGTKPEGEDCVRTNAAEGLWVDVFCDDTLKYICETAAAIT